MPTTRQYRFEHDGPWGHDEGHAEVLAVLQRRCDKYWWYTDPYVQGEAFRRLVFGFTVTARDKWFCHTRAMRLAAAVYMSLSLSPKLIPTPTWEVLPPHTNRGGIRRGSTDTTSVA